MKFIFIETQFTYVFTYLFSAMMTTNGMDMKQRTRKALYKRSVISYGKVIGCNNYIDILI